MKKYKILFGASVFLMIVLISLFPIRVYKTNGADGFVPLYKLFLQEDTAFPNAGYGVLGFCIRVATSTPLTGMGSAGTDGDMQPFNCDDWGRQYVYDYPAVKEVPLPALDNIYDSASETLVSADVDTTGYRFCSFGYTVDSIGVGAQQLQWKLQTKSLTGGYYDRDTGFWQKYLTNDTAVAATTSRMTQPVPCSGTVRIKAEGNSSVSATLYFIQASSTLILSN